MIIRCVTAAAITSGGPAQTIAAGSGAGSTLQPKAAIYELTSTTTLDAGGTHRRHGIGITDGTAQRCVGVMAESGQITSFSDAGTRANNAAVIDLPLGTSEAVDGVAAWTSWQNGGSAITWSDFPATACQIKATYFFGDDIECKVVEFQYVGGTGGEQTISGVGFQPNFAFAITYGDGGSAFPASTGVADLNYSFGYAVHSPRDAFNNDGEDIPADPDFVRQWNYADFVNDRNSSSTSGTTRFADDSFVCPFIDIGGLGSYQPVKVARFTSDGAVLDDVAGVGDRHIAILFIRFRDHKLFAGTGSGQDAAEDVELSTAALGSPGFRPEMYFICGTAQTAVNGTGDNSGTDVGKVSHGVYTGIENVYCSGTADDGVTPGATLSVTGDNYVFRVVTSLGADFFAATHVSLNDDSVTINCTGSTLGTTTPTLGFVAIGGPKLILSETERISDQALLFPSFKLPFSETETLTDQALLFQSWKLALLETERISDEVLLFQRWLIETAETEHLSDQALLYLQNLIRQSETVQIADGHVLALMTPGGIVGNDTVRVHDEVLLFLGKFLDVAETEGIFDGHVFLLRTAIFSINETERLTDSFVLILGRVLVANETVNITDQANFGQGTRAIKGSYRGRVFCQG